MKSKQLTRSQTSALFPCPKEGCSLSFPCFDSLQRHLDYGEHENTTSQESVYDQLRRVWVARFSTLVPENRPKPKSADILSVSNSSLPMGWALQKPRGGGTRYTPQVKDYLKARFNEGEESGMKADPQQVAVDMPEQKRTNDCSQEKSGYQETRFSPAFRGSLS